MFPVPQANSIERGLRRVARAARSHRAVLFLAALALSMVCFEALPADTLEGSLAQSAALAALALAAAALSDPCSLRVRAARSRASARPDGAHAAFRAGRLRGWTGYLLVVGLVAGAVTALLAASPGSAPFSDGASPLPLVARAALVAAVCLFTGVFEEGLFRAVALDALRPAFGPGRRGVVLAALASSVLFGALHVSTGDAATAGSAVAWLQLLLKPVQAMLFGFFMAALFVRTRSLWAVAGAHALFDLLYTGPVAVLSGASQATYVTGSAPDLVLLAATTALLVPSAIAAYRSLSA